METRDERVWAVISYQRVILVIAWLRHQRQALLVKLEVGLVGLGAHFLFTAFDVERDSDVFVAVGRHIASCSGMLRMVFDAILFMRHVSTLRRLTWMRVFRGALQARGVRASAVCGESAGWPGTFNFLPASFGGRMSCFKPQAPKACITLP
jgi:hypothetical protein